MDCIEKYNLISRLWGDTVSVSESDRGSLLQLLVSKDQEECLERDTAEHQDKGQPGV